jgi:subtilase family serine protease
VLSGYRLVPGLAPGAVSTGAVSLLVSTSTPPGTYVLLVCADDPTAVVEASETNNCRASLTSVQIGRPDLTVSTLSDPPRTAIAGGNFLVTDTVQNQTPFPAGASRVQYYLSLDGAKNTGDKLLVGNRSVPMLGAKGTNGGSVSVTIPIGTAAGRYFLLACADDIAQVIESNETNNCRASIGTVALGP